MSYDEDDPTGTLKRKDWILVVVALFGLYDVVRGMSSHSGQSNNEQILVLEMHVDHVDSSSRCHHANRLQSLHISWLLFTYHENGILQGVHSSLA